MDLNEKFRVVDSWLKSQDYIIVEEPEINANIPIPYLAKKTPAFLYTINCDYNYAFVPMSYTDYQPLIDLGYTPVKLGYENSNGPILSASGDLRIYFIMNKSKEVEVTYHYFLIRLKSYFDKYFDDVSISNNDILIDGKKVLGGAMIEHNGMLVVVFQINFVDKEEQIKKVCILKKKMPGHIDTSVVTAERVKDEILSWLTNK